MRGFAMTCSPLFRVIAKGIHSVNSYDSPKCLEAIRLAEQGTKECGYEWLLGMHTFLPHQRDCFNPLKILATLNINAGFRNVLGHFSASLRNPDNYRG